MSLISEVVSVGVDDKCFHPQGRDGTLAGGAHARHLSVVCIIQ